mmetsp:Transcript_41499/g.72929  ORF Transcript_41499/g.72929 Transcript_41499/m.72929 type:complete len:209 (-) Transcript_41499:6-632(-)
MTYAQSTTFQHFDMFVQQRHRHPCPMPLPILPLLSSNHPMHWMHPPSLSPILTGEFQFVSLLMVSWGRSSLVLPAQIQKRHLLLEHCLCRKRQEEMEQPLLFQRMHENRFWVVAKDVWVSSVVSTMYLSPPHFLPTNTFASLTLSQCQTNQVNRPTPSPHECSPVVAIRQLAKVAVRMPVVEGSWDMRVLVFDSIYYCRLPCQDFVSR